MAAPSDLPHVTFMTGNANKVREVKAILDGVACVDNAKLDLPELQGQPEEIAREKARLAYKELQRPVLVEDTSLCFNAMKGLPGPYVKWFLDALNPAGLAKMLDGFEDKSGYAQCIFALAEDADTIHTFIGRCPGAIVPPRGENAFGWDPIFEPTETGATFAEMSADAKNKISHRALALVKLVEYLKRGGEAPSKKPRDE